MTFGEKLQALRQRAGMSQDALAERLGVSRQAVSRWERDETMPETDKVVPLADLFGVTTDYLLRTRSGGDTAPEGGQTPPEGRDGSGSGSPRPAEDTLSRLAYLAKTRGYLLGWVLIAWGLLDLLTLLLMGLGVLNFMFW